MPQSVTVEAYNSLGSSTNNINMTLDRNPKREWAGIFILFNHILFYTESVLIVGTFLVLH